MPNQNTSYNERTKYRSTLSMQFSRSASLNNGGGLVTPESRVNVVGMNCDMDNK